MVFSSVTFLFYFLPVFMVAYFSAWSIRAKNLILLFFSLVFYAWGEGVFILLLLVSIVLNMVAARRIDQQEGQKRKTALAWSLGLNLCILAYFKYFVFFSSNIAILVQHFGLTLPIPRIHLPLGISFFTFHCISYLIDVYRRRFPAERDPVTLALYIALFPQLVAGPIVRYKTIARRFHRRRHTLGRVATGARIFAIGLAQKVLIADQVATLVEAVFDKTSVPSIGVAWSGVLAYTVQIYFDFAGYSNMASGLAVCLGFTFPRNFRLPYTALSITEFWRRWHMSLSSWLRDYLYIPLGGNRGTAAQTYRNLVTVFLLCGLWHGASWTFVFWGMWHGLFLVIERAGLGRILQSLPGPIRWAYAMGVVIFGWVLFRAADLASAAAMYRGMLGLNHDAQEGFEVHAAWQPIVIVALLMGGLFATLPRWLSSPPKFQTPRRVADAIWTFGILLLAIVWVGAGSFSPFLYFRF
jgi:alginate O-acetyltransferase complex protein AlgI